MRKTIIVLFFTISSFLSTSQELDYSINLLSDEATLRTIVDLTFEEKVNTDLWEYSPTPYESGIVYVGTRRNFKVIDKKHGTPFFTLKYAEFSPDQSLSKPVPFNIEGAYKNHDGPVDFYSDNKTMLFTKSIDVEKRKSKKVPLHLFRAHRMPEGWKADSIPLPFQMAEYTYAHPAIDEIKRRIYFASDMPGGYGGMDIWYVEYENDSFSQPINLGLSVNSDGNEVFPTLNNQFLFFSSDGREKTDDLDIFMTAEKEQGWLESTKLAYPFNTDKDDLSLYINKSGDSGYFSSQRSQGSGKDDIIRFTAERSLFNEKMTLTTIDAIVFDKASKKRLSDMKVWVFEADYNGLAKNKEFYETRFDQLENGEVSLRLKLKDQSMLPNNFQLTDINGTRQLTLTNNKPYIIVLANEDYSANIKYINLEDTVINELKFMMDYISCIPLSIKVNYDSDVPAEILTTIKNECNGEEMTLRLDKSGKLKDNELNKIFCLNPDCYYTFTSQAYGYLADTTILLSKRNVTDTNYLVINLTAHNYNQTDDLSTLNKEEKSVAELKHDDISKGTLITLRKIYYDYNKSAIRQGAAEELDALISIMKNNPSMKVELNSFTDSRGGADYNLRLSLDRAISAKEYMVSRGIAEKRIRAIGYGESKILNHCKNGVNCTDDEHQFNRRTEVRIIQK